VGSHIGFVEIYENITISVMKSTGDGT